MSRGRRMIRLKPAVADGFKFASASEAMRYEGLKAYAGATLTATPSADGRMLVCEFGESPRRTQAFVLAAKGTQKFNAKPVTIDGVKFGSGHEAKRFAMLQKEQMAGIIADLKPHPRTYEFVVNGVLIGRYTPDSEYRIVATGELVTEDAKSEATKKARDFHLRKKLMLACHGIRVREFMSAPARSKRPDRLDARPTLEGRARS
jgi:hypothetical protein